MKKTFLLILLAQTLAFMKGQDMNDAMWVMGYNPNDSIDGFGGCFIDFNKQPIMPKYFEIPFDAGSQVTVNNNSGVLKLYSNGCRVANWQHEDMENGDDLNPGKEFHDAWCETGDDHSYSTHQGMVGLPWPGREEQYVLFHIAWRRQDGPFPQPRYFDHFFYTQVDMVANGGLGKVVEKNQLLLADSNYVDMLTAVRHGNGRDWWIVLPKGESDIVYLFLLDPYGIHGPIERHTGLTYPAWGFVAGQAVFTPDGSKYIRASYDGGIDIIPFDRCKGTFSCGEHLPFPGGEYDGPTGAAVSPNTRYLYVSTTTKLFQYDLWSGDVGRSKILIDEYDGFGTPPLYNTFYQQMLAPDGKIYMTASNGVRHLHVIHQPDSAGLACDFRQHDLLLPTHIGFTVPNFPRFRLYDAAGSPCDTLGINAPEAYRTAWTPGDVVSLTPNPTSGEVTVRFAPCSGGWLRVFTVTGALMVEQTVVQEQEHVLDCSAWPAGVYVVSYYPGGSKCKPFSARLVVAH